MKKIGLIILFLSFACRGYAQCPGYADDIEIEVIKDYGKVIFDDTQPRTAFKDVAGGGHSFHKDTTGLTVANFNMSVEASGTQVSVHDSDYACVYLDKIKLYLTYDNIYVMIDNMYRKGGCQYEVILEHEKKHVAVHKKSLDYYAPYITGAMEKAAKNLGPRIMRRDEDVEAVLSVLTEELMGKVSGMLDFFEEERNKANARLDTVENYEEERKKCAYW